MKGSTRTLATCHAFSILAWVFISSVPFPPPSGAQNTTVKIPIRRPASPTPAPPEKTGPAPAQVAPAPAMDLGSEMKRLEALIQVGDRNAAAYFNRGWLHEQGGNVQKALQDYSKAIELDRGMKDAFYNRGLLFVRMKRLEEAIEDFSEVIRMEPSAADAYCNRGSIYFQTARLDLALADYDAGLRARPDDADLLFNRSLVHLRKGDKAAAKKEVP